MTLTMTLPVNDLFKRMEPVLAEIEIEVKTDELAKEMVRRGDLISIGMFVRRLSEELAAYDARLTEDDRLVKNMARTLSRGLKEAYDDVNAVFAKG